jgi:hypothetical protein
MDEVPAHHGSTRMPKIESKLTRRDALSDLAKVRRRRAELGDASTRRFHERVIDRIEVISAPT